MEKRSEEEQRASQEQNKKKGVIKIPSYQEVFGGGTSSSSAPQPYNPPPPPPSFSQAFSFIKASEFYTPPPTSDPSPRHVAAEPQPSATPTPPPPASSSSGSAPSSFYSSAIASAQNRNAILVSHRQKGNPLLKHIRNVRWAFADVVCDYLLGQSACALYISLRLEECGRYLETIKVYENKPADSIREQMDTDYLSRLTHALTTVRHVNKTDVVTLGSAFGSLSHIMDASMEDLARCPGIGERKVKRLYDTFHEPFKRVSSRPTIAVPETPIKARDSEESIPPEVEGKNSDSSRAEKESNLDVRSALTAAFDKYAERVRKQDRKSKLFVPSEGSSSHPAPKDAEA